MSSAWRRREYLGGAHRPDSGFLCGRNGLSGVPLLPPLLREGSGAGGRWGKSEAAVLAAGDILDFGDATISSRMRNCLIARRD